MLLARIRTIFSGVAGTPWYSNLYFDSDAVGAEDYAVITGQFWNAIKGYIVNDVTWVVQGEAAIIEDTTGAIVDLATFSPIPGVGTSVTEALPWACQAIVNWNTGEYLAGRQLRGKTFVPGLQQGANEDGVLLSTVRNAIDAAAEELIDDGNSTLRVFSPTHLTSRRVVNSSVPLKIGVLRSRRD